ncbi:MAG TPA: methyltransferase [Cytophagales bacterium]|nr:methyltransferase [Cytophagales bacterium]HAA19850.1 methyltransferase [Cytophagales bacterium]HAP65334.1 methyltransferase [Cytophagales bacterium]
MGRNSYFQFKQFTVHQGQCAMKVTTDACVFGALAEAIAPQRILDIGTGTGLLSLMLAQRYHAPIDAVELDEAAAQQASQNFRLSPWSSNLHLHQGAIQEFTPSTSYDLIVTNPPFFGNQLPSQNPEKRNAWHQTTLGSRELAEAISRLLSKEGKGWVLLPPKEASTFQSHAQAVGLRLHCQIAHHSFRESEPHLCTMAWGKEAINPVATELVYYKDAKKSLTEKMRDLLTPYYMFL